MSDTPEADNERFNGVEDGCGMPDVVTYEFAQKLERERNEARAERDEWIARFHADFARKLERERDQWNDIAERCIEYVYDQDWDPYACDIIKDYESLLKPASNTQQMNTSARYSSSTACDPRCPYCGRPVIGMAVYGSEGAYHPECTHPPKPSVMEELLRRKPEPKYEYPLPKAYQNFCSSNCPQ